MKKTNIEILDDHLRDLSIPFMDISLGDASAPFTISEIENSLVLKVEWGFPISRRYEEIMTLLSKHCEILPFFKKVKFIFEQNIRPHSVQSGLKPLSGISNIISIASGKGGVGKSTIAANLCLALSQQGAKVGILDADIYGPSQPIMLGLEGEKPISEDGKIIQPLENHGIKVMSIGFLIKNTQPMVWRGPMVTSALNQLLTSTKWGDLDYLLIDMPPGTGDIQLTISQKVPVSGAIIVTTPQKVSVADARKGIEMFKKVNVPILGVIENMSTYFCGSCGHEEAIFGPSGGKILSNEYNVPLLASLPLDKSISEQSDLGTPSVLAGLGGDISDYYFDAALAASCVLASEKRSYSDVFPEIIVEN
tara:strand:- start:1971 stop:3062 length:1092 start_codon:yes stop_codon:yes gene_type:complete